MLDCENAIVEWNKFIEDTNDFYGVDMSILIEPSSLGTFLFRSVSFECMPTTQVLSNLYYNMPSQKIQDLLKIWRRKMQTIKIRMVKIVLILACYHA